MLQKLAKDYIYFYGVFKEYKDYTKIAHIADILHRLNGLDAKIYVRLQEHYKDYKITKNIARSQKMQ